MSPEEKDARRQWFEALSPAQKRAWQKQRDWENLLLPTHNAALAERARKRMARVDELPPEVRRVVHDHGLEIVWEFWTYRITRPEVIRELISAVQAAEDPHSSSVQGKFLQRGISTIKGAKHLINTVLGADFPDGTRRFKLNKGPNAKQNPIALDDDDECYFVVGPSVLGGA